MSVLVCWGFRNKIPGTGGARTTDIQFSQVWRPEVQDQGASMAGFLLGVTSWLAVCSHGRDR